MEGTSDWNGVGVARSGNGAEVAEVGACDDVFGQLGSAVVGRAVFGALEGFSVGSIVGFLVGLDVLGLNVRDVGVNVGLRVDVGRLVTGAFVGHDGERGASVVVGISVLYVGVCVGNDVGCCVGAKEGSSVGVNDGVCVGSDVGWCVGSAVGPAVGIGVGSDVGVAVGWCVGSAVGIGVGMCVGVAVGRCVGPAVGSIVGSKDGE